MDQKIIEAAGKLAPQEISSPVYSDLGVTLLQLVERKEAAPRPFDEVKPRIKERLTNKFLEENFNYWIKEIREQAHIEVLL